MNHVIVVLDGRARFLDPFPWSQMLTAESTVTKLNHNAALGGLDSRAVFLAGV